MTEPESTRTSEALPPNNHRTSGDGNGHAKVSAKPKPKPKPPAPKPKACKVLPTDRIRFNKQLDLLRAYAIASGLENRAVSNGDVGAIVKMEPSTVSMANAFYTGIGFLNKSDAGFVPAPEVVAFNRAHEWNPETSAFKLAPIVERSWFMQCLLPKLRFQSSMDEREAIELLAADAAAAPHHRNQLRTLLEYGAAAGLVTLENGMVRVNRASAQQSSAPADPQTQGPPAAPPMSSEPRPSGTSRSSPLAAALFPSNADGAVNFHISVRVNMAEFAGWTPDRISSFFSGIAQVLAARGKADGIEGGD